VTTGILVHGGAAPETQPRTSKHVPLLVWKPPVCSRFLRHQQNAMLVILLFSLSLCWRQGAAKNLTLTDLITQTPKCAVRTSSPIIVCEISDEIHSFHASLIIFPQLLSSMYKPSPTRYARTQHDYQMSRFAYKQRAHGQTKSMLLELRANFVRGSL
jgi:hypothetical protein